MQCRSGRFSGREVGVISRGGTGGGDGQHVGFESWLERDPLVLMDFDPATGRSRARAAT